MFQVCPVTLTCAPSTLKFALSGPGTLTQCSWMVETLIPKLRRACEKKCQKGSRKRAQFNFMLSLIIHQGNDSVAQFHSVEGYLTGTRLSHQAIWRLRFGKVFAGSDSRFYTSPRLWGSRGVKRNSFPSSFSPKSVSLKSGTSSQLSRYTRSSRLGRYVVPRRTRLRQPRRLHLVGGDLVCRNPIIGADGLKRAPRPDRYLLEAPAKLPARWPHRCIGRNFSNTRDVALDVAGARHGAIKRGVKELNQ